LSPSRSISQQILDKALDRLGEEERSVVKKYACFGWDDPKAAIDAAYEEAKRSQDEYKSKEWVWTVRGKKVKLRHIADNVVKFIDKFKGVGDLLSSLDPVHAGLPWAGVKLLLEVRRKFIWLSLILIPR
jgi:hypothetical protein